MGEVINLRRARKARDRATAETTASANRALHGRTRAERESEAIERSRTDRLLDGARIEDEAAPPSGLSGEEPHRP